MKCQRYRNTCKECRHWHKRRINAKICQNCGEPRTPCGATAVKGYKYCTNHGGANPRLGFYGKGKASLKLTTKYKHKWPLMDIAAKYKEILDNPQLISLRRPIELIRMRIYQLLGRLEENESPQRMKTIADLWQEFRGPALKFITTYARSTEIASLFGRLDKEMIK